MDINFFTREIKYSKGKPQEWQDKIRNHYLHQMIWGVKDYSPCLAVSALRKAGKTTFAFVAVEEMLKYTFIKEKCGDKRFDVLLEIPYQEDIEDYAYKLCRYLKEHLSEDYGTISLDIMTNTIHTSKSKVTIWVRSSSLCLMSHEFGGIVVDDAHETNPNALWEVLNYTYINAVPSVFVGGMTRKQAPLEKDVWSLIMNNPSVKTYVISKALPQDY